MASNQSFYGVLHSNGEEREREKDRADDKNIWQNQFFY